MSNANFTNRTLWTGDNLDILRGLNSETVDLIYLDPPFNSNRTYEAPVGSQAAGAAFKDAWILSDLDVAWMGLIADEHPAIAYLLDASGKAHGKGMQSYLTMMAVRLLEMRRVLKPTGSIYLHCDPTASHYLKMLMDAVFGAVNSKNEIIWRRYGVHNDAGQGSSHYGRVHDTVLMYSKSDIVVWNQGYMPLDESYVEKGYRYVDPETGKRFTTTPLTGPGGSGKGNPVYDWNGHVRAWRYSKETMQRLHDEDRLYYSKTGYPRRKLYLEESKGVPVQDVWTDIPSLVGSNSERIGYPTQKPLALLERVIKASSNEGDVVLDPFCGCATACVAAEVLKRQWVGIDLSPVAYDLVRKRLVKEVGVGSEEQSHFTGWTVTHRTDIPSRTDIDAPINYRQNKHVLFGEQEGLCGGCRVLFPFRNFTIDHVIPQSKGGTDHLGNLQLLCGACNSVKGDRPQEYLVAKLREMTVAV